jgi:tripartite-type tricarboxylate transporter receptor subunit TctC
MGIALSTLAGTALVCCTASVALAQSAASGYPSKPVTIISPFAPGGSTEKDGRIWAQKLQESLGRPFLIDFKPGAGSTIGTNYVAKAAPDGYTLLIVSSGFSVNAATYADLPYDSVKDFTPLSLLVKRPTVLLVHPSVPVQSYPEYIAYVKARPGEINMATSGAGGISHMIGAWLHSATGTRITFVHYKGAGPMYTDLIAGRTQMTASSLFTSLPHIKPGKLRPLAILSAERSELLPGMKTVAEQGIPDFDYSAWTGLLMPAAVPGAIVNRLSADIGKHAKSRDMLERFAGDGTLVMGSSSEEFRRFLVGEITRWKRLAQEFNIKATEQ